MLTETPDGLDEIIDTYGSLDDPQFETKHIVLCNLPYPLHYEGQEVRRDRCHKLAVDNFIQAFRNVGATGLKDQFVEFKTCGTRQWFSHQAASPKGDFPNESFYHPTHRVGYDFGVWLH